MVDAFVLREMHRRCNHDREVLMKAMAVLTAELDRRTYNQALVGDMKLSPKAKYFKEQYDRSTTITAAILPHLEEESVTHLSTEHLEKLWHMVGQMTKHKPFPIVTIHDEFQAHPNNVNWVRWHYKEILAEIADSNLLDDLLSQLHGASGTFKKLSSNLGQLVRNSNYGLC